MIVRFANGMDWVIAQFCRLLVLTTGIALLGILFANVIARYALATGGFDWAQELPERLFPWFIAGGVVLAAQAGGHMAVEWLLMRLGRSWRRALLFAGHALVIAAYCLLIVEALRVADIASIERSPVLGLSNSHGYWAVALTAALIALTTLMSTLRMIATGRDTLPNAMLEEAHTT